MNSSLSNKKKENTKESGDLDDDDRTVEGLMVWDKDEERFRLPWIAASSNDRL